MLSLRALRRVQVRFCQSLHTPVAVINCDALKRLVAVFSVPEVARNLL